MIEKTMQANDPDVDDQVEYPFTYDHGRMPMFMKLIWVGFFILATWYTVTYLLSSLAEELPG